jgi:hypothetical protein
VDRRRIAEHQFIEFAKRIADQSAIEFNRQFLVVLIDVGDKTDVPVEDIPVVVVLDLHHLVADAEAVPKLVDVVFAGRIQGRQQGLGGDT